MSSLEKIVMEEISSLDELRLIDVLAFIRYLKMERRGAPSEVAGWFEHALETIRARAQELHVTRDAIESEVRAMDEK